MLGQCIRYVEPRRLRPDEDVRRWGKAWRIQEGAKGDVAVFALSDEGVKSEPHDPHRASWLVSSPNNLRLPDPCVTRSLLRSMPAKGLKAEPVALRHCEQWQFKA